MSYSIIIPAYNEEDFLPGTLAALEVAMDEVGERGQVVVVDNNSSDGTAEIAKKQGARVVFEPVNQISRARNAGAAVAEGRYFIFLDADTQVSGSLLKVALENLESGKCCGGGSVVTFDKATGVTDKLVDLWTWISVRFSVAAGSFVYCLREGFEATGGFSEAVYASEEIWFSRRLKAWGKRRGLEFRIVKTAPVVTSSRKLDWYSPFTILLSLVVLTLFPFAVRFRSLCGLWYKRPTGSSSKDAEKTPAP